MKQLSTNVLLSLIHDHANRVVNEMDMDTLMNYAIEQIKESFVEEYGIINAQTQENLLNDMLRHENGDSDSVYEFMVGSGIDENLADEIVSQFMDES